MDYSSLQHMNDMAISHIKHDGTNWVIQTNEEHLKSVAQLTAKFADVFGMADFGYITGILHII